MAVPALVNRGQSDRLSPELPGLSGSAMGPIPKLRRLVPMQKNKKRSPEEREADVERVTRQIDDHLRKVRGEGGLEPRPAPRR